MSGHPAEVGYWSDEARAGAGQANQTRGVIHQSQSHILLGACQGT